MCIWELVQALSIEYLVNWCLPVSLSTSHYKSILYNTLSTFSFIHSKIECFLYSYKTKFKSVDMALLTLFFTISYLWTLNSLYSAPPYRSTPTPLSFNLPKSCPKIFIPFLECLLSLSILLIIYCHVLSIDFSTVYLPTEVQFLLRNSLYETAFMTVLNSYNQTHVLMCSCVNSFRWL